MPQELYTELISRLARLRRRRESVALWSGVASGLTSVVVVFLIAIVSEMLGHFSIMGRTWLFSSALILAVAGLFGFTLPSLLVILNIRKRATDDYLASAIGAHYPKVSDRLLNTLQLARPLFAQATGFFGSPAFAMAAFQNTYSDVRDIDFNAIVDDRPMRRAFLLFFLSLAIGAAFFLGMQDEMLGATTRLTHFRTFYQKPAPFTFVILPGDARVMRGDSIVVTIATHGEQLQQISFRSREAGEKDFDAVALKSISLDSSFIRQGFRTGFVYTIRAMHPVEYYAEARDIESDHFKISVLDHPIVRSLSVEVDPPTYTRIKPSQLSENIGDISGVAGTRGVFRIVASAALAKADVVFSVADSAGAQGTNGTKIAGKSYPLSIDDSIATGNITFLQSGTYHIQLLDRDSVSSEHPIEYTVSISKDLPPQIVLIEPNGKADLPSDMRLEMLARIHDDYGFSQLRLGYRISKSKYLPIDSAYKWIQVPLTNYNTQDLEVPYIWNLTPLSIGPEDEVSYVMEVFDNDAVTGPKSARTPEYTVRVPSVEEIFKRADEEANKAQHDMNQIKQDAMDLQKKVNDALAEMQQEKPSDLAKQAQDFSKQKDVQQMIERQSQLNDRVEQVAKDLDAMTQSMEQQNALSPETMQKYQELQELFKQIDSPELKKAMEDLQRAMQKNVDPKQLADAMKNMKLNEEQFNKALERTSNILKKIQAEQKVDELMKSSAELSKQEQHTADSARANLDQGKKMTPEQKAAEARKQQDAQKELDRMRDEMKDVAQQMSKLPDKMQAPDETKDAAQALSDPSTDKDMQDAADDMQKGDQQSGSQSAQSAAKKMKKAQQKLAALKRKMSENERQRTTREMKQIRDELNRLSQSEEQIKDKAQEAAPNSNVFRDLAEDQSEKKDELGQTASKAMELAQKSTEVTPEMGKDMGKAFADMQKAEDAMTDRNQSGSQQNAESAMTSLNQASNAFQKALSQMGKNGQPGSGGSGGEGQEGQSGSGEEGEDGDTPGSGEGQGQGQGGGSPLEQFISQIDKLAAQQQALNDQMQGMGGSKSGGGQSAEKEMMRQQAEMSKLTAQQQAVQKTVEQLAQEQSKAETGIHQSSDELRKIADEMQQSIGDMKSSGVKPETIQRQERILSRLLQAEHSVHERDKDQERESKPGEDINRQSPRELDMNSPQSQKDLQQEILNSKETGYTPDYNALIRKYFEELEKK